MIKELKHRAKCAVYHTNKEGYQVVIRKKNPTLFRMLDEVGFFKFHSTNTGNVCGLHQIIIYLDYGHKAQTNGFTVENGLVEVHHYDGNPANNTPENLVYVSKEDHKHISGCTKTNWFAHRNSNESPTPFNRQGFAIKDSIHFLGNVIQKTLLLAKGKWISRPALLMNLPYNLYKEKCNQMKSILKIAKTIPSKLFDKYLSLLT